MRSDLAFDPGLRDTDDQGALGRILRSFVCGLVALVLILAARPAGHVDSPVAGSGTVASLAAWPLAALPPDEDASQGFQPPLGGGFLDGVARMLGLGPAPAKRARPWPLVLRRDGGGRYVAPGRLGGGEVAFVVDTAAKASRIGRADAARAGLADAGGGTVAGTLRLGHVDLGHVVLPLAARGQGSLVGRDLLARLGRVEAEGGMLRLYPR